MSLFFHGLHTPIEHVWNALDRRIQQGVSVPDKIQQLHKAIEEWDNIPQATLNSLINSDVYFFLKCCILRMFLFSVDYFLVDHIEISKHSLNSKTIAWGTGASAFSYYQDTCW